MCRATTHPKGKFRCKEANCASRRRLGAKAKRYFGVNDSRTRSRVEELEKDGILALRYAARAASASRLRDPELIKLAIRDKSVATQLALAKNPAVREDEELRQVMEAGRPDHTGATLAQDPRVLATLRGEQLTTRAARRLVERPETRAARLEREAARAEKRAAKMSDLDRALLEQQELYGSSTEMSYDYDSDEEDDDWDFDTADRVYKQIQAAPKKAANLSAAKTAKAWVALPDEQREEAAEKYRGDAAVVRMALLSESTRDMAFGMISESAPLETVAYVLTTLVAESDAQENQEAIMLITTALQEREAIEWSPGADPVASAKEWLQGREPQAA